MQKDFDVLKHLATEIAEIASLDIQKENAEKWRKVNDLEKNVRPPIWVNEEPWNELSVDESLHIKCEDPYLKTVEEQMRKKLYHWKHFGGDTVISNFWDVPIVTNFDAHCGIKIVEDTLGAKDGGVVSHSYETLFKEIEDVEKIQMIDIKYDEKETMRRMELLDSAFGDILRPRKARLGTMWFAIWDKIAMWYNPMELLMDLMLKPDLMHAIAKRYKDAMIYQLDQLENMSLLATCHTNNRVGSGGFAYCSDFDGIPTDFDEPEHVSTDMMWGCGVAQIFSEVGPDMHYEFSLQYEKEWMSRFKHTYYGCCEPLHNKMDILKEVPNLRKISCSPWCNIPKMVESANGNYVISVKPNPAAVATPVFDEKQIRLDFEKVVNELEGAPAEIIFKDISTCQNDVKRITRWIDICNEVLDEKYK